MLFLRSHGASSQASGRSCGWRALLGGGRALLGGLTLAAFLLAMPSTTFSAPAKGGKAHGAASKKSSSGKKAGGAKGRHFHQATLHRHGHRRHHMALVIVKRYRLTHHHRRHLSRAVVVEYVIVHKHGGHGKTGSGGSKSSKTSGKSSAGAKSSGGAKAGGGAAHKK